MYNASEQFHNAVFANSPVERVLFKFADDTIFTNEDIHIGNGLKVIEAVNLEEELTIGGCPASSLDVTVMNYHGLLSGFAFGEAEVSLGVRTETVTGNPVSANAVTYVGSRQFCGYSTEPYLKLDGEAPAAQPGFPVHAIVADGLVVYCIGLEGQCWKATLAGGTLWDELAGDTWADLGSVTWESLQGTLAEVGDVTLSAFMTAKAIGWAAQGRGLWYNSNVLYEYYTNGTAERYEYAKLGTFLLNTPAKRKINMIAVSALDKMSLFDREADAFWNGLTYPITIGEIFTQLCAFVGVQKATTSFINSARLFDEAPMAADGITAREILSWIAEAACSFARMTRDGEVELAWFGTRPVTIPMTQYFGIAPAEYEVAQVDKLQISGSETDIGVIIGEGNNGYQIMDNPLLYGETDAEIRTLGVPIYNRLVAYAAFSPINAAAVCDWSIQAGDIIEIVLNGVTYALPIYSQTITWKGNARVSYESSGAEKRPVMAASNRRVYAQKRAVHELNITVEGIRSDLTDAEGNIASLEYTTAGLALAVANNKLSFDANGLTVQGGGIRIKNNTGTDVLYADTAGNLNLKGTLASVSGSFTNLTATTGGSITLGGWTITADGMEYGSAYFDFEYSDGWAKIAGTAPMQVGPYTNNVANRLVLYGTTITPICSTSAYQMRFGTPGTAETSLYPEYAGTCNIGTSTYYFDYMHANHFTQHSLRASKKNIMDISGDEYDFMALRPIIYEEAQSKRGTRFMGFVAEEVESACSLLVCYDKETGKIGGLDYSRFSVVLTKELQRLIRRVDVLEQMMQNGKGAA